MMKPRTADPHPDLRGCVKYSPGPLAPIGSEFECPECGRVYVKEKLSWRAQRWSEPARRPAPRSN